MFHIINYNLILNVGLIYGLCNHADMNSIIKITSACGALTAETLGSHKQLNYQL